ncbi:protein MRVI1-like, partial [Arapaima gigas]
QRAFLHLSLAFHCNQYTLQRRLQAEEHDHMVAQENLHVELERSRDTVNTLKAICLDKQCAQILQQLQNHLEVISNTAVQIANTAEMLGAVHQEAHLCRDVEVMTMYMEKLKDRHTEESAELRATRKLLQKRCVRKLSDNENESEIKPVFTRQTSRQHITRRRVSFSLIPTTQLSGLPEEYSNNCKKTGEESVEACSENKAEAPCTILGKANILELDELQSTKSQALVREAVVKRRFFQPPEVPTTYYQQDLLTRDLKRNTPIPSTYRSLWDALHWRRRAAEVARWDTTDVKKMGKESNSEGTDWDFGIETCALPCERHPVMAYFFHCRWILFCVYFMAFSFLMLLGVLLWPMRAPLFTI